MVKFLKRLLVFPLIIIFAPICLWIAALSWLFDVDDFTNPPLVEIVNVPIKWAEGRKVNFDG